MIKVAGHYIVPKQVFQRIVVMLRCSKPCGEVTNGDVIDLMGDIAAILQGQGDAPEIAEPDAPAEPAPTED